MQLQGVLAMSYQGSPYSGPGDEYDFEDDGYDDIDDFRNQDDSQHPHLGDDSDEGILVSKSHILNESVS